jgi:hypothetical protein
MGKLRYKANSNNNNNKILSEKGSNFSVKKKLSNEINDAKHPTVIEKEQWYSNFGGFLSKEKNVFAERCNFCE